MVTAHPQENAKCEHAWGVILAGGEGVRLRPLTRMVAGDDRPKQFCSLIGGGTLLEQTRERIARRISADRTLFVLLKAHERYYSRELSDVPASRLVVQPVNRGTLPAILFSLLRIKSIDPDAVVSFFPSDHYYADEESFMEGIKTAVACAESDRDSVIMMGSAATHPETEYGWIEVEPQVFRSPSGPRQSSLMGVKRFMEKPSLPVARDLLNRGCVWNTFVMVGHVDAFLKAIGSRVPDLCRSFEFAIGKRGAEMEMLVNAIYSNLPVIDLSSQVLAASPRNLRVLCLGDIGWSDLGNSRRLMEVISHTGEVKDWLPLWRNFAMRGEGIGEPRARAATAG